MKQDSKMLIAVFIALLLICSSTISGQSTKRKPGEATLTVVASKWLSSYLDGATRPPSMTYPPDGKRCLAVQVGLPASTRSVRAEDFSVLASDGSHFQGSAVNPITKAVDLYFYTDERPLEHTTSEPLEVSVLFVVPEKVKPTSMKWKKADEWTPIVWAPESDSKGQATPDKNKKETISKERPKSFRTPEWEIKIESYRWLEFVRNNGLKSTNLVPQGFGSSSVLLPKEGFRLLALLCCFDRMPKAVVLNSPEASLIVSNADKSCEVLGLYLGHPVPDGPITPNEQGYATGKWEAVFVVPTVGSDDGVLIRVKDKREPTLALKAVPEIKDGRLIEYDRKNRTRPTAEDKEGESPFEKRARDLLPAFKDELQGQNPVRVLNPNEFAVVAGIRSGRKGIDFAVPANGVQSAHIPDGKYEIFFVYSTKPDALFQGDSFTLKDNGVEIQIVRVVNGNYNIRQVK